MTAELGISKLSISEPNLGLNTQNHAKSGDTQETDVWP
jgi:hypothetical protein